MFNSSCNCSTVRRDQGCCISEIDVAGDGSALAEMGTPGNGCPQPNCSTYTRKLWESTQSQRHTSTQSYLDYPNKERITNPPLALSYTMIAGLDSSSGSVSSGVALYIYVKFWTLASPTMLILAIPIFIVGIIKYGERVWALFQASKMGMEFQSSDKVCLRKVTLMTLVGVYPMWNSPTASSYGISLLTFSTMIITGFEPGNLGKYCRISKLLLDYMMYLLFLCPAMLPQGIDKIRHHDTCIEAKNFVHDESNFKQVIRGLFGIDIGSQTLFAQMGSLKKSAFFEGCQIAVQLQTLLEQFRWGHEDKWKLIADVWLDMLNYVTAQCSWKEHARQLQQGEELFTPVALLMAHLGLGKNIQKVPLPKRLQEVQYEPTFYWDRLNRLPSYWT
ncbi:hypothetical protein Gotur_015176 [Gossypium turneri]